MNLPKSADEWTEFAKNDPLAFAAASLDLFLITPFVISEEYRQIFDRAFIAVIRQRLHNADRRTALIYKAVLKSKIVSEEKGAPEAMKELIKEIDQIIRREE